MTSTQLRKQREARNELADILYTHPYGLHWTSMSEWDRSPRIGPRDRVYIKLVYHHPSSSDRLLKFVENSIAPSYCHITRRDDWVSVTILSDKMTPAQILQIESDDLQFRTWLRRHFSEAFDPTWVTI